MSCFSSIPLPSHSHSLSLVFVSAVQKREPFLAFLIHPFVDKTGGPMKNINKRSVLDVWFWNGTVRNTPPASPHQEVSKAIISHHITYYIIIYYISYHLIIIDHRNEPSLRPAYIYISYTRSAQPTHHDIQLS